MECDVSFQFSKEKFRAVTKAFGPFHFKKSFLYFEIWSEIHDLLFHTVSVDVFVRSCLFDPMLNPPKNEDVENTPHT